MDTQSYRVGNIISPKARLATPAVGRGNIKEESSEVLGRQVDVGCVRV